MCHTDGETTNGHDADGQATNASAAESKSAQRCRSKRHASDGEHTKAHAPEAKKAASDPADCDETGSHIANRDDAARVAEALSAGWIRTVSERDKRNAE